MELVAHLHPANFTMANSNVCFMSVSIAYLPGFQNLFMKFVFSSEFRSSGISGTQNFVSPMLQQLSFSPVRFQVFTAVTMKNGVFWDVTPCGSCKNRRFRGT
jgi:hypothetical protein